MPKLFFALLFLFSLNSLAQSASTDSLDPLPPRNYDAMVSRATSGLVPQEIQSVRLLAWHTQEDGRPLRYDAALVWLHLVPPSNADKWVLVMLARHPLAIPPSDEWVLSFQGHSWTPVVAFNSPPRNKEVYQFIDGHWEFEPDGRLQIGTKSVNGKWLPVQTAGFRLLVGAVRVRTWHEVIGDAPIRYHVGEKRDGE